MIAFAILAVLMIASAVFVITARRPVHSVVGLLAHFVTLAILYLTLQAEFLAVMQIVVYSGAILILFVFVIALLSSGVRPFNIGPDRIPRIVVPAVILALAILAVVVAGVTRGTTAVVAVSGQVGEAGVFGSVANFGDALFRPYLLPFEVTAFILMVAIVGVVLIAGETPGIKPAAPARRERRREPIAR